MGITIIHLIIGDIGDTISIQSFTDLEFQVGNVRSKFWTPKGHGPKEPVSKVIGPVVSDLTAPGPQKPDPKVPGP